MATIVTPGGPASGDKAADGGIALLGVGAAMDLGGRAKQEDAMGVFLPDDEAQAHRGNLLVLADGLGGHSAGERASRLAVQTIGAAFYASPMRQPGNLLHSAIEQANRRIIAAGQDPSLAGLGSTCVCAVVQGDTLWVANVGDSRAYLLRMPGGLQQLTHDDSLAAEQVRQGLISAAEAADSAMGAVLLQALGTASGVQPHFAGPVRLQKGDLLLLCSDGLYNALDDRAMQDYLLAALHSSLTVNPQQLARDLVEGACFRGTTDNTSVLLVYCQEVVPEAVARAAGWPEQQAQTLLLPVDTPNGERGARNGEANGQAEREAGHSDSAPAATAERAEPNVQSTEAEGTADRGISAAESVAPILTAQSASRGTPWAPRSAGQGRGRMPALPTAALIVAVGLLVVLVLAWVWAAFAAPRLLVPIFLGLAGLALTTLALLFSIRPWTRAAPAPEGGEWAAPEATRGLDDFDAMASEDDPIGLLITRLLPDAPAPSPVSDRGLPGPPTGAVPTPPSAGGSAAPAGAAPRVPATPLPAPTAADADYVSQAMSAALGRARQQWTFNLLMAAVSASLVIGGCILTVVTFLLGQPTLFSTLFGPGVGLLGIASWLVTQPAAQLNRADNQISLLTIVWTNYAQELRSCTHLSDPAAVAACNARAGAEAVQYFNQIVGAKENNA